MLADQLSNVGAPVSNQRLVLRLIAGLNENYDGVATFIQQSSPLPLFYEARSRVILEETRKTKQVSAAALLTTTHHAAENSLDSTAANTAPPTRNNTGPRRGNNRNNYKGKHGRGGNTQPQWRPRPSHQGPQWFPQQFPGWGWSPQQWAAPPCPYPTSS